MNAARYLEPVRAVLERDVDRAVELIVTCVLEEPDVSFDWAWTYAGLIHRYASCVECVDPQLEDVFADAAAFIGAASIDDIAGARIAWEHLELQRRAEVAYALADIAAEAVRLKATS